MLRRIPSNLRRRDVHLLLEDLFQQMDPKFNQVEKAGKTDTCEDRGRSSGVVYSGVKEEVV